MSAMSNVKKRADLGRHLWIIKSFFTPGSLGNMWKNSMSSEMHGKLSLNSTRVRTLKKRTQKWELFGMIGQTSARGPRLAVVSARLAAVSFEIMAANSFYCQSSQK